MGSCSACPVRRLLTLTLIALLSISAVAMAATPSAGKWRGTKLTLGKSLKFTVKGGKITKISARVEADCDASDSEVTRTFAPDSAWKVSGGKFSGRHKESIRGGAAYFTFKGRFTSSTAASGKLRYESIVAGSKCDTYDLQWKAKKG